MKSKMLVGALLLSLCSFVLAEEIKLDGIKCPISGEPVKTGTDVAYKGGKVFFCCTNCPKAFEKDTAKFATKANLQLAQTKQATEVKCPIAGRDLNPDTAITVSGVKVAFCCGNCKGKAEAAKGDDQVNLVFSDAAFAKGFKVAGEKK